MSPALDVTILFFVTDDQNGSRQINIDFLSSKGLNEFLEAQRISVAVSTYQSGNVFLVGPGENEGLRVRSVIFERPMGMCAHGDSLFIGGLYQIHRLNNVLPPGVRHEGSDRLYIPHLSWTTGEMDCHDLVVERSGRVVFVNTLYSCLAAVSSEESFIPVWKPPTVSALAPEDRCHLNGVATRDGQIRYASAFARTDTSSGWREDKRGTGVVWDIASGEAVVEGLSIPHSPRWSNGRLWLLESGSGSFGYADLSSKTFRKILSLPGYLRGLAFHGKYAVVGSSIPRQKSNIDDAEVLQKLTERSEKPYCGLFFVNIETEQVEHFIRISGAIQEIFDVAVLPGVQAPDGVGMRDERIKCVLRIGAEVQSKDARSAHS